jgi:hypothetical protein
VSFFLSVIDAYIHVQFPFASTTDGGASAIWNCIPEMCVKTSQYFLPLNLICFRAQDIQGGVISSWKSRNKVTADTHFEFQIQNWDCKKPPTPPLALVAQRQQVGSSLGTETGTLRLVSRVDASSGTTILSMGKYLKIAYWVAACSPLPSDQDVFPPFDESDSNNHTIVSLGDMTAGRFVSHHPPLLPV